LEEAPFQNTLLTVQDWLRSLRAEPLAREAGFCCRQSRKITPGHFVEALVSLASHAAFSLTLLAFQIGLLHGSTVSKQSVWERLGPKACEFLKLVVADILGRRAHKCAALSVEAFQHFGRVLVEDSTSFSVPEALKDHFPGASNNRGEQKATAKIHAIFELLSRRFVLFGLSGFTRNDQKAAGDVLQILRPRDLVLRDLGYYVVATLKRINQAGAFFLTRLRLDASLWDGKAKQPLKLLDLVRNSRVVDRWVCLGSREKMPVRLVAVRLSEAVAAERRRKAKNNRDKRCHPSKEYLELLGWAIFVTNVPRNVWNARQVAKVYRVRWTIEIIFKACKSYLRLDQMHWQMAQAELEVLLYARLILAAILAESYSVCGCWAMEEEEKRPPVSLLKLAKLLQSGLMHLALFVTQQNSPELLALQLDYHSRYDRRRRPNMVSQLFSLT
jgi:hypothetical protein